MDAATKIVRFSLNPHILALDGAYCSFPYPVGTIVKNAQVIRVDPGIGALLALPPAESGGADEANEGDGAGDDESKVQQVAKLDKELGNNLLTISEYRAASRVRTAYVHISKSMNDDSKPPKKGGKKDRKGSKNGDGGRTLDALFARHFSVNCRIKSLCILSTTNLVDGIASCATAKSIVEAHVLTHADLVPGRVYEDVPVLQLLESGGVLVDLGVGTKGIIPLMHLFDKSSMGKGDDLTGSRSRV